MASDALTMFVDLLRGSATDDDDSRTVEEWRQGYEQMGAMLPQAPDASVTPVDVGGVNAEWITSPSTDAGRTVVYLHGGGYNIGSLSTHRSMLTHLAAQANARVLAVDYRLAPEHPYPAAVDDAVAAYRFALADGATPERTVIAGDSAGGGLALATLVALRDGGDPLPAGGVCLSPWVDLTQSGDTMSTKADVDPMLKPELLDRWAATYAGDDAGAPGPSPLFADLAGLPPLIVEVGELEVLLDDAKRLTAAATEAGVDVAFTEGAECFHVWHFAAGMIPESDEAMARVGAWISKHTG